MLYLNELVYLESTQIHNQLSKGNNSLLNNKNFHTIQMMLRINKNQV